MLHTDAFDEQEKLQDKDIEPRSILSEPKARNVAATILAECMFTPQKHENATSLYGLSDHVMPNTGVFSETIKIGTSRV